jgi:hypothetical protein
MNRRKQNSRKQATAKATRSTLPKAIAAAYKSGDKNKAMDLAIYERDTTSLTELARRLFWYLKVQRCKNKTFRDAVANAAAPAQERTGDFSEPPPKRDLDTKTKEAIIKNWCNRELNELKIKMHIGMARSENFTADFEREYKRVFNEDATAILFDKPGTKKSATNNPNWFRQILIANLGLVETKVWDKQSKRLISRKPVPLARIAKVFGLQVRGLRREARKMGVGSGTAGRPKGK